MKDRQQHGRPIDIEELKKIQMDVLDVVDRFCEQIGIHYSLACGSFLGAIRHKGYIPWDDDIDIYIKRADYNKFISEFPEESQHVRVVSLERDDSWDRAYAQAFDCRTILQEGRTSSGDKGVYIDIYPIDNVPDSDEEWLSYNKKRRILIRLSEIKYVSLSGGRSLVKNLVLAFGKLIMLPFSSRKIAQWISKYAQKHNEKGFHRSFECVQGMLQKRPFDASLMNDISKTMFEDREFMIMRDYDAYLSNAYGDYMKLPPKEKQLSHHVFKAWWKKSGK